MNFGASGREAPICTKIQFFESIKYSVMHISSILFVCTANRCRSPVAAITLQQYCKAHNSLSALKVDSAGTWVEESGLTVDPKSMKLAKLVGVDLSSHRTKSILDVRFFDFDRIAVMEKSHQEALQVENPALKGKIFLVTTLAGLPASDIPDPILFETATARDILLDMQACVRLIGSKIAEGEIEI